MNKAIILVVFSLFSLSCYCQNNCAKFKTGAYMIADSKFEHNSIVERTDSTQIEIDLNTGQESIFRVNWISSCEYELTVLEAPQFIEDYFRGKVFCVKIIETLKDGYKFEGFLDGKQISANEMKRQIK